jgi:hypothetical protein
VQCDGQGYEFLEVPDSSAAGREALRACREALTRLLVV